MLLTQPTKQTFLVQGVLRDSHLSLENETLRENTRLILDLNSQYFWKNSHSHSQLSKIIQLSFSTLDV